MKAQNQLAVANQVARTDGNPLGVAMIDPQSVSNLPLAQYYQMAGHFVNVQNAIYYDTGVYTAGTAVTQAQRKALFTKGKNQDDTVVNTGVAIPEKGEFLTNMISDGEFEGGTTFILEQICVHVFMTSELPTTLGVRGEITAPNYTASVVISAANNFKAYTEQIELQYLRNEELKLRAPLTFWPSPFGASGGFGSPNSGFVQNGYQASWNMLTRPVVLQSEDKFSFVLQPIVATFTPTIGATIRVVLLGKAIKAFIP